MRHLLDGIARYNLYPGEYGDTGDSCSLLECQSPDGQFVEFEDVQARLDAGWVKPEINVPAPYRSPFKTGYRMRGA